MKLSMSSSSVNSMRQNLLNCSIQKQFCNLPPHHTVSSFLEMYAVFHMLDTIRPTSCGLDMLPDWFLRRMAVPSFALPLSYLFNLSLQDSIAPSYWKTSSITLVPKVVKPQRCQDYRPISVTTILSKLMEKDIVRSNI